MAGSRVVFWGAAAVALLLFRTGVCQNFTSAIGDSVIFHGRLFVEACFWEFIGEEATKFKGEMIVYGDKIETYDQVYSAYKDRIAKSSNCTFILQNVKPKDQGWYRLIRDFGTGSERISYHYLHIIDPICDVSILTYPLKHATRLVCNVTGDVESISWAHNGKSVQVSQALTGNRSLDVPINEAEGHFECHVQCSEALSQSAHVNLTLRENRRSRTVSLSVVASSVGLVVLVIAVGILLFKCPNCCLSRLLLRKPEGNLQFVLKSMNNNGIHSNGWPSPKPDPSDGLEPLHNGNGLT